MNLSINDLRAHLSTCYNWWLGGWQDAWVMLPKPRALQARPATYLTKNNQKLSFITSPKSQGQWQAAIAIDDSARGLLLDDDSVLLRTLSLPSLSEKDLIAALSIDVQVNSPFKPSDTHYGYSIHRQPSGLTLIEIAIIHRNQLTQNQAKQQHHVLFAKGQYGAIPLHSNKDTTNTDDWYRSPLTLSLGALTTLMLLAWAISPTLLLRAESMLSESALAKLSAHAAPLLQKREELNALQQQIESLQAFDREHPNPLIVLDQLSTQIPDGSWLSQYAQRKDQLNLEGVSGNAIAIVSLLEKLPDLKEVRLGASINRDPRSGGETFQILARIQPSSTESLEAKP